MKRFKVYPQSIAAASRAEKAAERERIRRKEGATKRYLESTLDSCMPENIVYNLWISYVAKDDYVKCTFKRIGFYEDNQYNWKYDRSLDKFEPGAGKFFKQVIQDAFDDAGLSEYIIKIAPYQDGDRGLNFYSVNVRLDPSIFDIVPES